MKGCKYCLNNTSIITFDYPKTKGHIYVENSELLVSNIYGITDSTINYCPMCGTKLNKEEQS